VSAPDSATGSPAQPADAPEAPETPATTAPIGPSPVGYNVPSLGWRILGGGLRLIPLLIFLVGVPAAVLTFLSVHGIAPPIPLRTVELAGIVIAVLVTLRYILKPTAAYGPLSMATSAVGLLYLYVIWLGATYRISIGNTGAGISLGYADLILLLMIGPALALVAGAITTYEDAAHPKERLPFDYPA
jgi:hypothetical protein